MDPLGWGINNYPVELNQPGDLVMEIQGSLCPTMDIHRYIQMEAFKDLYWPTTYKLYKGIIGFATLRIAAYVTLCLRIMTGHPLFWRDLKNRAVMIRIPIDQLSSWWFQICFIFTLSSGNDPIWRAYFFNWVDWNHQLDHDFNPLFWRDSKKRPLWSGSLLTNHDFMVCCFMSLRFGCRWKSPRFPKDSSRWTPQWRQICRRIHLEELDSMAMVRVCFRVFGKTHTHTHPLKVGIYQNYWNVSSPNSLNKKMVIFKTAIETWGAFFVGNWWIWPLGSFSLETDMRKNLCFAAMHWVSA